MTDAPVASPPADTENTSLSTPDFVGRQVARLQNGYLLDGHRDRSWARASLARLRRGAGKDPGALPELLEYVVQPGAHYSSPTVEERHENAAYAALTFYAIHQQSQRTRMHRTDTRFGSALGGIRYSDGSENQGVVRRFNALVSATEFPEIIQHARGLITLLRAAGRGFDYVRFTWDLINLQDPTRRDSVRLAWGRDFYGVKKPDSDTTPSEEQS